MAYRLLVLSSALLLAAGCEHPSRTGQLHGARAVQTVNGQPAPESLRDRVALVFLKDGTCQRGGEAGTFEVLDDATIRTRFGDRVEVMTVEVSGDTLTMRTAEGVVTGQGRTEAEGLLHNNRSVLATIQYSIAIPVA